MFAESMKALCKGQLSVKSRLNRNTNSNTPDSLQLLQ
jgi:hypothetical protein